MERYNGVVQDSSGNIITTATITVYLSSNGAVASIFLDDETTAINNPFTIADTNYDLDGSFWFKAANSLYDVKVVSGADTSWVYDKNLSDNNDQTIFGANIGVGTTTPNSISGFDRLLEVSGLSAALSLEDTTNGRQWELGATGGFLKFNDNSTEIATLGSGLKVGAPIGGDKGPGSINATAVYDDNVLLTCYVFDQAVDGEIKNNKWDSKVPNTKIKKDNAKYEEKERTHEPMRMFKKRLTTKYNPLDIDKYSTHWKDKKHLTSMPNEDKYDPENGAMATGKWIQRLIETVEIQAVHIDNLNERLKKLE